jgi:hypothetical protein
MTKEDWEKEWEKPKCKQCGAPIIKICEYCGYNKKPKMSKKELALIVMFALAIVIFMRNLNKK